MKHYFIHAEDPEKTLQYPFLTAEDALACMKEGDIFGDVVCVDLSTTEVKAVYIYPNRSKSELIAKNGETLIYAAADGTLWGEKNGQVTAVSKNVLKDPQTIAYRGA